MVYPCLLAAVSDPAHHSWRARALSVYRFWRDLGYAIGALTVGLLVAIVGVRLDDREYRVSVDDQNTPSISWAFSRVPKEHGPSVQEEDPDMAGADRRREHRPLDHQPRHARNRPGPCFAALHWASMTGLLPGRRSQTAPAMI